MTRVRELEGRSAVVAGGAGGLGGATVRRLTELGAEVVVLDPAAEPSGRAVAGGSDDDEAVGAAIALAQGLGRFAIAVSATGVVIRSPRLIDRAGTPMPVEVLRANLDLHVIGPFNLSRLCAAAFAGNEPDGDGQRGVLVHTASISATDGQVTMVPYAAAKAAVAGMVLPMARDLAPIGVRVCAIAPGGILTPRLSSPQAQALLVEDVVFPQRLGRPEEYASLVEAIVGNPYLNGEVIRLDGATRLGPAMGWRGR